MLCRIPRQLPPFILMIEDLGNPKPAELARALGVTKRTVFRWLSAPDDVPRPVLLSLFWLTRWGMSAVDAEAMNSARLHAGMVAGLRLEIDRLRAELARVVAAGDFGCANDYTAEPLRVGRAQVLQFRPRPARVTSAS